MNLALVWNNALRAAKKFSMATHAQVAGRLLRDAATFFRNVAAQNAALREQLNDNAAVYDQVAALVEAQPLTEIDLGPEIAD